MADYEDEYDFIDRNPQGCLIAIGVAVSAAVVALIGIACLVKYW